MSAQESYLTLALLDGVTAFEPGAKLEGTAVWQLAAAPERLEVRLFWYTAGKGTRDVGVVETAALTPAAQGQEDFHFQLPRGPYSFSGTLVSILWALELVAEPSGKSTRQEIVVAPGGREVRVGPPLPPPDL